MFSLVLRDLGRAQGEACPVELRPHRVDRRKLRALLFHLLSLRDSTSSLSLHSGDRASGDPHPTAVTSIVNGAQEAEIDSLRNAGSRHNNQFGSRFSKIERYEAMSCHSLVGWGEERVSEAGPNGCFLLIATSLGWFRGGLCDSNTGTGSF